MKNSSVKILVFMLSLFFLSTASLLAEEKSSGSDLTSVVKQAASTAMGDKIDINSASSDTLAKIPGVGSELGSAITNYRDTNGKFSAITDLLNIDGIDAGLLEKITPFLTL